MNAQESHETACITRELVPGDAEAVRGLFAQVFHKPMSEALWRWKYASAQGHGIGVWKGGELLAHYGGMGRGMLYFGKPERAVQITDVMVKTAGRSAVRKGSPFYLAGKAFLERHIGYGKPYLLGFGFPSDRHMKLAEHLGLYAPVGRMVETVWETDGARKPLMLSCQPLTSETSPGAPAASAGSWREHAGLVDELWKRLAGDLANNIVAIKDAAFLRGRYLEHPEHRYELHLVRRRLTRVPLGLVVLRHEQDHTRLMDVVGPLKHVPAAVQCARVLSARAGRPRLLTWCSRAFARRFQVWDASQSDLPIITPTNILTPGPAPEELQDKWWLMPGDTDFL